MAKINTLADAKEWIAVHDAEDSIMARKIKDLCSRMSVVERRMIWISGAMAGLGAAIGAGGGSAIFGLFK